MSYFVHDDRIVHCTVLEATTCIKIEELCQTILAAGPNVKKDQFFNENCDVLRASKEMRVVHLSTIPDLYVISSPGAPPFPKLSC